MPRTLNRKIESTPLVSLTGTKKQPAPAGRYLVGILKDGPRIVRMKKGSGKVFEFGYLRTNAPVQKKDGEKGYINVQVNEQDTVSLFAPTVLAKDLEGAAKGEVIIAVYLGLKQTKDGTDFHAFQTDAYSVDEYQAMSEEELNAATQIRENA